MNSTFVQTLLLLLIISAACQAGTVACYQSTALLKCPSKTCVAIGNVRNDKIYPSDCFVIGKDPGLNSKYFRINLTGGGYGYVNGNYCSGNGDMC
ncbi:unnamed protein product [Rotaria magnacalcarata]|uniref:Uncharacterized protein n=2 Tax=Rotaria magnacalcarata TaxID=392030 RepID=A0A816XTL4_9BILA|nr:unnamed protein product [Rotaria magnacalcarata]CAF2086860.1 unnamed protein product [Rotaria magnacalcarata]CAF2149153.1 unnamed protein product [Rotaria magnacalcarata]CAF4333458.1 unnamed protein product [Rotaria magnacalcarata]CAF4964604.1 unnamed protein product [Rotaria magnacalcarata]